MTHQAIDRLNAPPRRLSRLLAAAHQARAAHEPHAPRGTPPAHPGAHARTRPQPRIRVQIVQAPDLHPPPIHPPRTHGHPSA